MLQILASKTTEAFVNNSQNIQHQCQNPDNLVNCLPILNNLLKNFTVELAVRDHF